MKVLMYRFLLYIIYIELEGMNYIVSKTLKLMSHRNIFISLL